MIYCKRLLHKIPGNFRSRSALLLVAGMLVATILSGCAAVAPLVQAYSEIGLSRGDRAALLQERLKEYGQALYWGNINQLLAYSTDEYRTELKNRLLEQKRKERIVETTVEFVDYDDSASNAEVDLLVRYYQVPYYVVQDRRERQQWQFSMSSGWQLTGSSQPPELDRS